LALGANQLEQRLTIEFGACVLLAIGQDHDDRRGGSVEYTSRHAAFDRLYHAADPVEECR
jgi:hypothetical protein